MSVSIMNSVSGGGGISSDEVTAIASDVLKGKTYLGNDTNDEIGIGTFEFTGDLETSHALAGKTFYSNTKWKQTGQLIADSIHNNNFYYNQSGQLAITNGSVILIYSNKKLTFDNETKDFYTIYEYAAYNSNYWYGYTLISKTGSAGTTRYVTAPANTTMLVARLGYATNATVIN